MPSRKKEERTSRDYERPDENVANMPRPPALPKTMARQGETSGHMRVVLTVGIALAVLLMLLGYLALA